MIEHVSTKLYAGKSISSTAHKIVSEFSDEPYLAETRMPGWWAIRWYTGCSGS